MTSRAAVMRPTGDTTTVGGFEVTEWAAIHTDLPLRVGGSDRGGSGFRRLTVGESETQVAVRVASFPAGTDDIADGDLIEVTSGECVGLVLRILESTPQDQATARRVPVVEEQRPEEWS